MSTKTPKGPLLVTTPSTRDPTSKSTMSIWAFAETSIFVFNEGVFESLDAFGRTSVPASKETAMRPLARSISSTLQFGTESPIRNPRPTRAGTERRASFAKPMSTKTPDTLTLVTMPSKSCPSSTSSKGFPSSCPQSRRLDGCLRRPLARLGAEGKASPKPSSGRKITFPESGSQETTVKPFTSIPFLKLRPSFVGTRSSPSLTAPKSTKTPKLPTFVTTPAYSVSRSISSRGSPSG
mmetsp:Transcript_50420/g.133996  ORF Transcript_50420/g.133996 Transcript_50420/m.133996 type:complete len:237 (-) Transcript_50420:146-856(-)